MPLIATCPGCQQSYQVGEQFAGKTAKCPGCGQPFVVPHPPAADPLEAAAAMQSSLAALPSGGRAVSSPGNPLGVGTASLRPATFTAASGGASFGASGGFSAGEPVEWALKPGITCSILGIGGFLLPLLGVQFKVLALLGPAAPVVAGVLALVGALLLFLGLKDNLLKALPAAGAVFVLAFGAFVISALGNANNPQLNNPPPNAMGQFQPGPPPNPNPPPAPIGAGPLGPPGPRPQGDQPPQNQPPAQPKDERPAGNRAFARGEPLDSAAELPKLALDPPGVPLPVLPAFAENQLASIGELREQPAFSDRAPDGCWLVGLRVVQSKNWGGAICGIQPIYQFEGHYGAGKYCGASGGIGQVILLARPGFAVSGIRCHVGLAMNSLQLDYRKVDGQSFVAEGAYSSEWVGCEGGGLQAPLDGEGRPIVGLEGTFNKDLTGLRVKVAPK